MTITTIIMCVTLLISWNFYTRPDLFNLCCHYPYLEKRKNQWFRLLTGGFLHGDWGHLLINLLSFYGFGMNVELTFRQLFGLEMGSVYFLVLYLGGMVFANFITYLQHKDNQYFRSVGASGAVSAVIFSSMLIYPNSEVGIFFVIPMKAIFAGFLFLAYSSYAARQSGGGIDHVAHFFGAVFGFLFPILLEPGLWGRFLNELGFN